MSNGALATAKRTDVKRARRPWHDSNQVGTGREMQTDGWPRRPGQGRSGRELPGQDQPDGRIADGRMAKGIDVRGIAQARAVW
jgi:hypothetical protein